MATKLKNLKIRKVDFVDEGANPDAHIRMVKSKKGTEQPVGENEKGSGFWKRLFSFIGKAAGMEQDEIDSAMDEIQKGDSVSFGEKYTETKNRKIADEIWDICYALQSSLCSILCDEELDSTAVSTAMQGSLDEFCTVMQESIGQWSSGKAASIVKNTEEVSEADLDNMRAAVKRLQESIDKAGKKSEPEPEEEEPEEKDQTKKPKGDKENMKIDKSKLTPAELAFVEDIEKRCGVEEETPVMEAFAEGAPALGIPVTEPAAKSKGQPAAQPEDGDIYKGIHPAVKAELEALKKFREDAENSELERVAEKYTIIGKKKEELVPVLKSLKAAGGTAYDEMIAVLDQTVETVEKSGAFSEIGKNGHGNPAGDAETKIHGIAKGMMEKDPSMSFETAVAKAWEENPNLIDEYESEAGF